VNVVEAKNKIVNNKLPTASVGKQIANEENIGTTNEYKAKLLGQTIKEVVVKGGESIVLTVLFQNTGNNAWPEYSFQELATGKNIVKKNQTVVAEGSIREELVLIAPNSIGTYKQQLLLLVNGVAVPGAVADVMIQVTENAATPIIVLPTTSSLPSTPPRLASEPRIRVGMALSMAYVQFQSLFDDYRVMASGAEVVQLLKGQLAVVRLENGVYTLTLGTQEFQTSDYFRFEPMNDIHAPFELLNYEKRVAWKGNPNFNAYRGVFEYRQGKVDKLMYAVNETVLEDYVAGIAETSNLAPYEYIKALLVAARTYAYVSTGKYPFFDVVANTYDQLFLGYKSEVLMPKVVEAARDTRGKMIAYQDKVVVTPYFANSYGQTKSWTTVWGGRSEKPWLVPVTANYDVGQPQRGHGVGMSARDAAQRADKEGVDWIYLVKYYYTGVDIVHMYD
jgi:hypothetical protein